MPTTLLTVETEFFGPEPRVDCFAGEVAVEFVGVVGADYAVDVYGSCGFGWTGGLVDYCYARGIFVVLGEMVCCRGAKGSGADDQDCGFWFAFVWVVYVDAFGVGDASRQWAVVWLLDPSSIFTVCGVDRHLENACSIIVQRQVVLCEYVLVRSTGMLNPRAMASWPHAMRINACSVRCICQCA